MLSEQLIKQVVSLLLDVEESDLTSDTALSEIEGWDSVAALRVIVYLEQERSARIDYPRFMAAHTLGELCGAGSVEGASAAGAVSS